MGSTMNVIGMFGLPGGMEMGVILLLGLLLFGRRLPEVGRSMGRSVVEFRKGIRGIEDEIEQSSTEPRTVGAGASASAATLPNEQPVETTVATASPTPPVPPVPSAPPVSAAPADDRRVSKADEVE